MQEISMNILDIAQNSISAGSSNISILIDENSADDLLTVVIEDDGKGMSPEQVQNVTNPFYTTRTTRKVGFGVPFFKMAAEMTGGSFEIESEIGKGTVVKAVFALSHIDRMPLGNIGETIGILICLNEEIRFSFDYRLDEKAFSVRTDEFTQVLDGVALNSAQVMQFVRNYIEENIDALR